MSPSFGWTGRRGADEFVARSHAMSDSEIQRTKASNAVTQIRKQQEGELASSCRSGVWC